MFETELPGIEADLQVNENFSANVERNCSVLTPSGKVS
jgi:hypothetical protein